MEKPTNLTPFFDELDKLINKVAWQLEYPCHYLIDDIPECPELNKLGLEIGNCVEELDKIRLKIWNEGTK